MEAKIVSTPGTCSGKPRIDGTRLKVEFLKEELFFFGEEEFLEGWGDVFLNADYNIDPKSVIKVLHEDNGKAEQT